MLDLLERNGSIFASVSTPLPAILSALPTTTGPLELLRNYSISTSNTWTALDVLDARHRALNALGRLVVVEDWEDEEETASKPASSTLDVSVCACVCVCVCGCIGMCMCVCVCVSVCVGLVGESMLTLGRVAYPV